MKKKILIKILSVEIIIFTALLMTFILILMNDDAPDVLKPHKEFVSTSELGTPEMIIAEASELAADLSQSNYTQGGETAFLINEEETINTVEEAVNDETNKPITITFCGDILIDSSVKRKFYDGGREAVFPIEHAEPFLNADIAMINLEFPLSNRGYPIPDKEFTFRGDPEHISFFTEMGIDIVTLANNHIIDYGYDAFLDTLDLLDETGIKYVGAGRNLNDAKKFEIFEVSGKKIAFLSASRVIPFVDWYANSSKPGVFATYDPAALNEQIVLAKDAADYVIVYVHWGVERNTRPEGYQINMARSYIDNGADAVIGSHPHVLQGFEFYNGKPIVYSLGNFIFTDANKDTMIVTLTLEEDTEPVLSIIPYQITDRKTTPMEDEERALKLREHLQSISFSVTIGSDWVVRPLN